MKACQTKLRSVSSRDLTAGTRERVGAAVLRSLSAHDLQKPYSLPKKSILPGPPGLPQTAHHSVPRLSELVVGGPNKDNSRGARTESSWDAPLAVPARGRAGNSDTLLYTTAAREAHRGSSAEAPITGRTVVPPGSALPRVASSTGRQRPASAAGQPDLERYLRHTSSSLRRVSPPRDGKRSKTPEQPVGYSQGYSRRLLGMPGSRTPPSPLADLHIGSRKPGPPRDPPVHIGSLLTTPRTSSRSRTPTPPRHPLPPPKASATTLATAPSRTSAPPTPPSGETPQEGVRTPPLSRPADVAGSQPQTPTRSDAGKKPAWGSRPTSPSAMARSQARAGSGHRAADIAEGSHGNHVGHAKAPAPRPHASEVPDRGSGHVARGEAGLAGDRAAMEGRERGNEVEGQPSSSHRLEEGALAAQSWAPRLEHVALKARISGLPSKLTSFTQDHVRPHLMHTH